MKKRSAKESVEFQLKLGDMLMDYIQDGDGNQTDDLAIGFVCKIHYDGPAPLYIVDWSDCGEEEHYADNPHLMTWRLRYLDYEKRNKLDNAAVAAAGINNKRHGTLKTA